MRLSGVVLGAPFAGDLARFYQRLLGWEVGHDQGNWVVLRNPDGGVGLSFQTEEHYVHPVWPAGPDEQQMMVHLDIGAADLDDAIAWAIDSGASLADHQPQDDVRVMLDPAGHPFCLFPLED